MRHDNSNDNHTEQPEQFDEVTGGYTEREHDRAARRIMQDIRAMEATPRDSDLLKACKLAAELVEYSGETGRKQAVEVLRAAIARATR